MAVTHPDVWGRFVQARAANPPGSSVSFVLKESSLVFLDTVATLTCKITHGQVTRGAVVCGWTKWPFCPVCGHLVTRTADPSTQGSPHRGAGALMAAAAAAQTHVSDCRRFLSSQNARRACPSRRAGRGPGASPELARFRAPNAHCPPDSSNTKEMHAASTF